MRRSHARDISAWNVTPLNALIDDLQKSEIRRHVTHALVYLNSTYNNYTLLIHSTSINNYYIRLVHTNSIEYIQLVHTTSAYN